MIICPRCQAQNPDGAPWCQYCGLPFNYQSPPSQQIIQYNDSNGTNADGKQSQPQSHYPPNTPQQQQP